MNKRLGELNIRNLMIIYVILYTIMPIVQRLTSRFLTAYFYMAVVVILVILIVVLDRPENLSLYGTFLLPFVIYGILTSFYTSEDFFMWGYQTLIFLLPVILGYYLVNCKSSGFDPYLKIMILAFSITMITTIIGCIQNPNAARILATVDSTDKDSLLFDMKNIGGYNFVYMIVLMYPVMILSYKMRKVKLIPTVIFTLIALFTVVYSEYTTALLLFIITSLFFFTKRKLSAKGIIIITFFSIIFLFLFSDMIVSFLHWLGDIIDSKAMSSRLDALADGRSGIEKSEDNRLMLYQISLYAFFKNPLLGSLLENKMISGGHSFILDIFALYGILGGIPVFFMYKNIFKVFFLPFKDKPGYGYVVWTFIQAIILSIVNTSMWLEVLCLFVPILLHWIYGTESKTEDKKDEVTVDSQLAAGSTG